MRKIILLFAAKKVFSLQRFWFLSKKLGFYKDKWFLLSIKHFVKFVA